MFLGLFTYPVVVLLVSVTRPAGVRTHHAADAVPIDEAGGWYGKLTLTKEYVNFWNSLKHAVGNGVGCKPL